MIWEGAYNGYPTSGPGVPEDQWVVEDVTADNFWLWVDGVGGQFVFNKGLDDWYGFDGSGAFAALDEDTVVYGVSTAIGSGWSGSYLGYVDNVVAEFDGGSTYSANFEAVPLPAAAWLGLGMLGLLGLARRARRRG
jgi:hypothetical protein